MADSVQRPPAATDVIESEELVQYIHPSLLNLDYTSLKVKTTVITGTFVFFTTLFFVCLVACKFVPVFRTLRTKHKVFMSLAAARGVFGICCLIVGSYAIFKTTNIDRDVVFGRNITTALSMYFCCGFFIFELSAVIISDVCFNTFSKMLITHHGLGLVGYAVFIYYEANFSFGCRALILELSTPFSCLCFVLLKVGKENSLLWRINQMVLVHTFHLRSVIECYMWYVTYNNCWYIWYFMPTPVFTLMYLSLTMVSVLMTPYWGYKKTQQLFNPVDWNFQESKENRVSSNGHFKKEA